MEVTTINYILSNYITKHIDYLFEMKRNKNEDVFFVLDDYELSFNTNSHTPNGTIDYRSMFGIYKVSTNDLGYVSKEFVLEWWIRRSINKLFKKLKYHKFDKKYIEYETLTIKKKRNKNGN